MWLVIIEQRVDNAHENSSSEISHNFVFSYVDVESLTYLALECLIECQIHFWMF